MTLSPLVRAARTPVAAALLALAATACWESRSPVRAADQATTPSGTIAVSGGSLSSRRRIALIRLNGRTRLVRAPDDIVRYDLSPDGSRLVVSGASGLWTMRSDGTHPRRIFGGGGEVAWSPDGRRIAVAVSTRSESLVTLSADGKAVKRIATHADDPDWTFDGKQIVFIRDPEQSSRAGAVSLVSSGGGRPRRIVDRGRWTDPHVSPDGSKVIFEGRGGIFVAAIGGRPRLLIRKAHFAAWSPDGRYIAFTRAVRCGEGACTSRVFVASATGRGARAYGPEIADIGPVSWSR